ncbi:MAG: hypothetical protein MI866_11720, partial [Bacteroidales bacterium]|nr:hypothetical protein [Bacteroidales bacterium]
MFPKNINAQAHSIKIIAETPNNEQVPVENNFIQIQNKSFAFHWYSDSINISKTRYRLVPYSKEWSPWTQRNSAAFFNLKEGNYLFLLELPDGQIKEASIQIDLPVWKHPLFYISGIVILSFIGFILIVILFRQRIRKITHNIEEEFKKAFKIKQKAREKTVGVNAKTVKAQARIRSRKYKK